MDGVYELHQQESGDGCLLAYFDGNSYVTLAAEIWFVAERRTHGEVCNGTTTYRFFRVISDKNCSAVFSSGNISYEFANPTTPGPTLVIL